MRVWVTGAGGMLGGAVCQALQASAWAFDATDAEVDVADEQQVRAFVRTSRPTHIINCAAYTQVDRAEEESQLAMRVNRDGVGILAQAALEAGAHLVHLSTDYVFGGTQSSPYTERDLPHPLGVYGQSKLAGEAALWREWEQRPEPRAYVVRTSWLFGPHGENFVSTMLRLLRTRSAVRVVDDQWGRPTYTPDLADALLWLAGLRTTPPAPPGTYHFANNGETTWFHFASAVKALWRAGARLVPISTEAYGALAPRPERSVLDVGKILRYQPRPPRAWLEALQDYRRELEDS